MDADHEAYLWYGMHRTVPYSILWPAGIKRTYTIMPGDLSVGGCVCRVLVTVRSYYVVAISSFEEGACISLHPSIN